MPVGTKFIMKDRLLEGFSHDGVPMELPVQVAKVSRPLFATREIKAAGNATIFGLDGNHAIVNKNTGKIVCHGGEDCILDLKSGYYRKTGIKDNGKDYLIEMYVERQDDLDITQRKQDDTWTEVKQKRSGDSKAGHSWGPQKACLGDFMHVDVKNKFEPLTETFTRQP